MLEGFATVVVGRAIINDKNIINKLIMFFIINIGFATEIKKIIRKCLELL